MFSVFLRISVLFFSQEPMSRVNQSKRCNVKVMKLRPLAIILSSSSQEIEFDRDKAPHSSKLVFIMVKSHISSIRDRDLNIELNLEFSRFGAH